MKSPVFSLGANKGISNVTDIRLRNSATAVIKIRCIVP